MTKQLEDFIRANALSNATDFGGKANPKALLGKVIPQFPEVKSDMKSLMQTINSIVNEINSLSQEEQKKQLEQFDSSLFEKKEKKIEEKDGLPSMSNTDKKVIVRFEPAPSGHLHLGHLYPLVANYEFKKKYKGKFILRIADTNPDNIDLVNYEKVIEDVKWICEDDIDEITYQSDRLEIYYKYLKDLFKKNKAYVCECDAEEFKNLTDNKEESPYAKEDLKIQKERQDKFMNEKYKPGEAVARFRADINHKNPALRTFPLARINTNQHARVKGKHSIWPNMHLAVAIDDIDMKLTHVIRGKDHEVNMERQMMVHVALGMNSPQYFHMGRMKFTDMILSKTELTEKIEKREFSGWDDPRVPSLLSHRKRGYKPEAFRKLVLKQGISKRDSKITKEEYYKTLDYFNKEILEKESNRYFFTSYSKNPKKAFIDNFDEMGLGKLEIQKHPEDKSKGFRTLELEKKNYIDEKDFEKLKVDDTIRLKNFANFKVVELDTNHVHLQFISKEYDKDMKLKANIQFLPIQEAKEAEIIMDDNSKLKGYCENTYEEENVQFERFAFVRFDREENNKKVFYYTHR